MRLALALTLVVAVTGCIRLGSGDDLHLVCEEKTASPRKAYDIGFLVAQTRVEGELDDKERVAMLEAARHHVIAPGGRPHFDFAATLAPAQLRDQPTAWAFDALAGSGGARPDVYHVILWPDDGMWLAGPAYGQPGLIRPPASVAEPAWETADNSSDVRDARPTNSSQRAASWDPALPSCVRLEYASGEAERLEVVVNVVQDRVVLIDRDVDDA